MTLIAKLNNDSIAQPYKDYYPWQLISAIGRIKYSPNNEKYIRDFLFKLPETYGYIFSSQEKYSRLNPNHNNDITVIKKYRDSIHLLFEFFLDKKNNTLKEGVYYFNKLEILLGEYCVHIEDCKEDILDYFCRAPHDDILETQNYTFLHYLYLNLYLEDYDNQLKFSDDDIDFLLTRPLFTNSINMYICPSIYYVFTKQFDKYQTLLHGLRSGEIKLQPKLDRWIKKYTPHHVFLETLVNGDKQKANEKYDELVQIKSLSNTDPNNTTPQQFSLDLWGYKLLAKHLGIEIQNDTEYAKLYI